VRIWLFLFFCALALSAQNPAWDYQVRLEADGKQLNIDARFVADEERAYSVDSPAEAFVEAVEEESNGNWKAVERKADRWRVTSSSRGVHLRYRFRLSDAAAYINRLMSVSGRDGLTLARPNYFLLRPVRFDPEARTRFKVNAPKGFTFVSGLHEASPGVFEARADDLDDAPYSAFGRLSVRNILHRGVSMQIAFPEGSKFDEDSEAWIRNSVDALASTYGRFPVSRVALFLVPSRGSSVGFGTASGNGGAGVIVILGRDVKRNDLQNDWVLTHEFIHLAMPNLSKRHHWFEEGVPTYLEPLLRTRQKRMKVEKFWFDLMREFLTDLDIREKTNGVKTIEDALREIVAQGGTTEVNWDMARVLEVADRGVGLPALSTLYRKHAERAERVDLEVIWKRLGVVREGDHVRFDDQAPLAELRKRWFNAVPVPTH
jgi:predicted metalloprotease with PDZ domain